ncbi:bifunctional glycosyltransferase family 2 protein/CDP-glycerol:glycerophosphate glycerophosphotransferase [Microbispora sp. H10836]|uniref:bifunctional glycosyltransferase/CDP-glycerol:glycerophosphate glycerophosphotransferase n=1 Tax=Microbispora sp. H10836 TaxID=2729106 RepID=UPI001473A081|nr:bifunctional glycosyltransferase family 2 protein/CDP-glycerol:glycerophosphate glycerophosphotransferase [Microbispora sp. H10836]
MTVPPSLSVVVPLHGGEEHAEECLESLRDQTLDDLEVILVGRPRLRPPDHRFTLLTLGDGGDDLGVTRNAGAAFATGRYLAFADPGSVVPTDAYRALVGALDHTGSDLACGRIRTWTPNAQDTAPKAKEFLRTHITRHPKLLDDPRAGGTVFRREFWNRHAFAFPAGLGEDFPVTIPAHVLSTSADVLGSVVCLTRGSRPPADPLCRLRASLEVSDLLGRHAPALRAAYDLRLAEGPDFEAVLDAVRDRVPDGLAEALGRLDPGAVERLPVLRRLQIHFAAQGMTGELAELRMFAASEIRHRGVLRRGLRRRRWYLDYPFRRDPRLPRSLFDATRDLRLVARVDDVRHTDDRLVLAGHAYIAHLDSGRSGIELWLQRGEERLTLPVRRTRRPDVTADSRQSAACHDDSGFETVVALDALPPGRWALHARVRARGVTRAGRAAGGASERVFDAGGVRVSLTRDRGLTLGPSAAGGPGPDPGGPGPDSGRVSAIRWTESGELILEGTGRCPSCRIVLECGTERHAWPVRRDEAVWTVAVGATAEGLPLRSGTWRVLAVSPEGREDRVRLSPALIADPPRPRVTGFHEVSVRTSRDGDLSLVVRPALGPHERGPYATRRRRAAAPRRTALRNAAVFDSYGGGQYSCNPRAVSEELARRHPDVEIVWVTRDGQFAVPPGVRLVLFGSREHEEALRTSRFVVANRRTQPGWYRKPRGQTFVQTWHGTPLKRLGLDLEGMPYARRVSREELARQVATWDLLLSPSPFATAALRGAFGYEGEILESGYPRNDVLFDPARAREARRRLGLTGDRRVVLYAPTWRDDEATGRLALDPVRAAGALGDDDVLLVRAHYLVARDMTIPAGDRIHDVSKFPDMADLLAAADVLVTDYSSAMFDFACTGRPMVFLAHDLERYRDEVRGFYFDFEAEAPGPVLRTGDDVFDVLRGGDLGRFAERYERFARRYCPWDDGHASARVVARMRS